MVSLEIRKRRKAIISVQDYKSFARYLRVLESIYNALVQDTVITKRAIYYGDVELFGSQKVVDQIIEEMATNYRVPRNSLNVAAASKGLVTGPMSIYLKDGAVLRCHCNPTNPAEGELSIGLPVLIPYEGRIESIQCDARLVLVVEKEVGQSPSPEIEPVANCAFRRFFDGYCQAILKIFLATAY
ncbi:hypothetical protein NQZ79_g1916 [Umbelopsis isabellina]|nr:hypothetical protein NQZ79_g1916 [Umbelopsis isabellina]